MENFKKPTLYKDVPTKTTSGTEEDLETALEWVWEYENLCKIANDLEERNELLRKQIVDLEIKIWKLKEVLKFYAEPSTYCTRSGRVGISPIDFDYEMNHKSAPGDEYPSAKGAMARKALKEIENEK